jgi:predicted transcriptional regulator
MGRTPQHVTDAELAVLQALWEQGPATRRQLTDALYPEGGASQYTTVQKLLERLEAKGCVAQKRSPDGLIFSALIGREELISRRLRDVADKLCGGSLTPLLMNLVRAKPLDKEELRELQDLLDRLSSQRKPRGKPR